MAHHKIAFLADTHGLLREEVVQKIKDCEVIFHAGDFGGPEIVERLQQIAPVYTARGNNDKEWAKDMPYFVREQIGNRTFYMCHKKQDLPDDLGEVDFVICSMLFPAENSFMIQPINRSRSFSDRESFFAFSFVSAGERSIFSIL